MADENVTEDAKAPFIAPDTTGQTSPAMGGKTEQSQNIKSSMDLTVFKKPEVKVREVNQTPDVSPITTTPVEQTPTPMPQPATPSEKAA